MSSQHSAPQSGMEFVETERHVALATRWSPPREWPGTDERGQGTRIPRGLIQAAAGESCNGVMRMQSAPLPERKPGGQTGWRDCLTPCAVSPGR